MLAGFITLLRVTIIKSLPLCVSFIKIGADYNPVGRRVILADAANDHDAKPVGFIDFAKLIDEPFENLLGKRRLDPQSQGPGSDTVLCPGRNRTSFLSTTRGSKAEFQSGK